MRYLSRSAAVLAAVLALGACSGGDAPTTSLLTETGLAAKAAFKARSAPAAAPATSGIPQGLSRASIAAETRPMMLVNIATLGSAGTLLKTGENRGHVTWVSPDLLTLTTKDGVMSASRGLPQDLMAGDPDPTLAAIRAGGAPAYSKVLRHISGDRQLRQMSMTCAMTGSGTETLEILERSHTARRFVETCSDTAGETYRNDYWVGSDGTMWRSRQFLHPAIGYVDLNRLIR